MRDIDKMPFGIHKGKMIGKLPSDYLLYVYTQYWIKNWPDVKAWIENNLEALEFDVEVNRGTKYR